MKRPMSLFWKTFTVMLGMLMGITLVISALIYLLMPSFYRNYLYSYYQRAFLEQLPALEASGSINEEAQIAFGFLQERQAPFAILNENGNVLFTLDEGPREMIFIQSSEPELTSFWMGAEEVGFIQLPGRINNVGTVPVVAPAYQRGEFRYTTSSGERTLLISIPMQPLTEARHVIIGIFPIAGLISTGFALIISLIFSRWFVVPIKKIQEATSKMAKIQPDVVIAVKSQDEIGALSEDINSLYEQLHATILTLEGELKKYADSENRKIEFLQTVTHEMKTPLASANSLLEGILYDIPPYNENQRHYLESCKSFLDKTIQLTKESLRLSQNYQSDKETVQMGALIQEVSSLYKVILRSKQIFYREVIPADLFLFTQADLLKKVLSNIFSNAANHTPLAGTVEVKYEKGWLLIENSCIPLREEELEQIFKPLTVSTPAPHSTGMGLYIVKQLLYQLNLPYDFVPNEEHTGMVFKIRILQDVGGQMPVQG